MDRGMTLQAEEKGDVRLFGMTAGLIFVFALHGFLIRMLNLPAHWISWTAGPVLYLCVFLLPVKKSRRLLCFSLFCLPLVFFALFHGYLLRGGTMLLSRLLSLSEALNRYRYPALPLTAPASGAAPEEICVLLLLSCWTAVTGALWAQRKGRPLALALAAGMAGAEIYFGVTPEVIWQALLFGVLYVLTAFPSGKDTAPVSRGAAAAAALLLAFMCFAFPGVNQPVEDFSEALRDRLTQKTSAYIPAGSSSASVRLTRPESVLSETEPGSGPEETGAGYQKLTRYEQLISRPDVLAVLRVAGIALLSLLLLVGPFAPFIIRERRRREYLRPADGADDADGNAAVRAMFPQAARWITKKEQLPAALCFCDLPGTLGDPQDENLTEHFRQCLSIWQKARFSTHPLSEKETETVRLFWQEARSYAEQSGFPEKRGNKRRLAFPALLVCLCLLLTGCADRTRLLPQAGGEAPNNNEVKDDAPGLAGTKENPDTDGADESSVPDGTAIMEPDRNAPTRHSETADQKEYARGYSGELREEASEQVSARETDDGGPASAEGNAGSRHSLTDASDKKAVETLAREQADRLSAADDAPRAESQLQFYTALLNDRVNGLFECKRLYVYWERPEELLTVHKNAPEHAVLENAGAYDVSARRTMETLHVDEGWISRKNPDAVVKSVREGALPAAAGAAIESLRRREGIRQTAAFKTGRLILISEDLMKTPEGQTAAAVVIACMLYPDQMADVDPARAVYALLSETEGELGGEYYHFLSGKDGH